jgi:hypothetical protein
MAKILPPAEVQRRLDALAKEGLGRHTDLADVTAFVEKQVRADADLMESLVDQIVVPAIDEEMRRRGQGPAAHPPESVRERYYRQRTEEGGIEDYDQFVASEASRRR